MDAAIARARAGEPVPRAGLSTAAVVGAAAELADAEGLEALTLARLAGAVGVRAPSLYNHVAGLERRLPARRAASALRELGDALREAAVGRARRRRARRDGAGLPRLRAASIPAATRRRRARRPRSDERAASAAAARRSTCCSRCSRGYGLEGDDAIHAARAVRSALHGFVALEAGGGFGMPVDLDESFDRMVAALAAGSAAAGYFEVMTLIANTAMPMNATPATIDSAA